MDMKALLQVAYHVLTLHIVEAFSRFLDLVTDFCLTLQPNKVDSPIQIHVGSKDDYVSVRLHLLSRVANLESH